MSFGLLIMYIRMVMASSSTASALGVVGYIALASFVVLVCLLLVWRYNRGPYRARLERWKRSYICSRCGVVSEQEL